MFSQGREPHGTTKEQLLYSKKLYDSAFHPDTGDKMNIFGRMSFQMPGGMIITGAMLSWYRYVGAQFFRVIILNLLKLRQNLYYCIYDKDEFTCYFKVISIFN